MGIEFRTVGLGREAVDYRAAWAMQQEIHRAVVAGSAPETVLLLEHPAVFTAGRRTEPHERPATPGDAEVIDVDRGGKITFHGPGQLVGYPIVRLPDHVLVVDYVRRLEEALIAVC
ncbi:MAG: lipoyl(octanoyl) transferase LipB, partial [Nocardioides sp.]